MKITGGWLMPVVGPSGAGKDSLIRAAQIFFEGNNTIVFPRRVVTRKANTQAEDHDSLGEAEFQQAVATGAFALWWGAHGNAYGIPAFVNDDIVAGKTVVFNCSREILADVAMIYDKVRLIEVTAPEQILVDRIVARGRESREQAMLRVARKPRAYPASIETIQIDNGGSLAAATAEFIAAIERLQKLAANPG